MPLPAFLPGDTRHQGVRGLIACISAFTGFLGFWVVHAWAQYDNDVGRYYDAINLGVVQHGLELAMLAAAMLGGLFWRSLRSGEQDPQLPVILTALMAPAYTLLGIGYGLYTTPMGFVIMGLLAFGLVFFDRRAVIVGIVACVIVFAGNEWLMKKGLVDYAPLLSRSMFEGDSTQLAWWWGLQLRVILYVAFFALFALLLYQVEQLEAQRRALEKLAVSDPLTGVANRRRFSERLEEEVSRRQRTGRPFCVLMCDADHFKKVNDTHGHHAGDVVIQHLASVLAANVRTDVDVVGRLGGEEFGVILAETSADKAQEVAQRIVERMREHFFEVDGTRFRVTISVGLAESSEGSGEDALRAADANLYRAKGDGRDRVVAG